MRSAWKVVSNRTSDRTRRCPTRCADPVWTKQRGTRPGGAGRPTATHHHGCRHLVASLPPRDERSSPATSTVRLESAAWRQSSPPATIFGRSELAQQAPQIPFVAQFRMRILQLHIRTIRAFPVRWLRKGSCIFGPPSGIKVVFSGFLLEGRV